jgi:glycosyltransferase involved in cell wall biosynthesis
LTLKLTIITINYNNVVGLKKTIESVVNQTSNDFEYIVIDGGSNDGSADVIKQYESKISYWNSEPDNGIYHAMNKGIKVATGEYCQFLNSGDCLVSSTITTTILPLLDGSSIIYGNLLKKMPEGKVHYDRAIATDSLFVFYTGSLNHASSYINRSLFEQYGFYDETLRIVSDWKFFLITVGLNAERAKYYNFDIVNFDMSGISNKQRDLEKAERQEVLNKLLPKNLLMDFDIYNNPLRQFNRLKKYNWALKIIWLLDRLLFKWEKYKTK